MITKEAKQRTRHQIQRTNKIIQEVNGESTVVALNTEKSTLLGFTMGDLHYRNSSTSWDLGDISNG